MKIRNIRIEFEKEDDHEPDFGPRVIFIRGDSLETNVDGPLFPRDTRLLYRILTAMKEFMGKAVQWLP